MQLKVCGTAAMQDLPRSLHAPAAELPVAHPLSVSITSTEH